MEPEQSRRWYDFFSDEKQRLLGYVRSRMQRISDMDAEDIVGEVMMNVLTKLSTSGPVENLSAYVYRSIHNRIVDYQRQRPRTVSLQEYADEEENCPFMDLLQDPVADVGQQAEKRALFLRLTEALDRLEPRQRAVFIATELKGKTFRELSLEWHEPIGTLLSRKCRAVKALREMLQDWSDE